MAGPFELSLRQFAEKAGKNADAVVRKVVLDVGSRLVVRSPVRSGRFRGNWFYTEGAPSSASTQSVNSPEVQDLAALPAQASGRVHYITNSLPYAWKLEHGHSKQAPAGMVGLTVVEFQSIVSKAALEIKTGEGG